MEFSWNIVLSFISFIILCNSQDIFPDLKSLDLFGDHPMDIGALLPETLLKDSKIPASLLSNSNTSNPEDGFKEQTKVVSLSASKPTMAKTVFSMKNAEVVEVKPTQTTKPAKTTQPTNPTEQTSTNSTFVDYPTLPDREEFIPKPKPPTTSITHKIVTPTHSVKPDQKETVKKVKETKVGSRVLHEFLPQNMLKSMQGQSTPLNKKLKDSFNIAGSSVLLSDVFNKPWNKQGLTGDSYILRNHIKSLKQSIKHGQKPSQKTSSFDHLTALLQRENYLLNIALGLITKDKNILKDSLKKKSRCPYKPYTLDNRYFMEKVKDAGWMKRRCALGTAYDQETCECSIFIGYQPIGCTPELVMDFNNGLIEDLSENKIPSGVEGVVSLSDLAYFSGAGRIIFWRYTNFDFQHSIGLKFRFKSEAKVRSKPHPLITNCGTGMEEPSFGVILNSFSDFLTFFVKTTKSNIKFLTFKIKPMEWNDVIYTYDGEHLIGKVNDLEKKIAVKGNIEIRSAEMTVGHCERYGWFKGFMDDVKIYSCVPKE